MPIEILEAHKHSSTHREELRNSEVCGCFYCLDRFDYRNIEEWIGEDNDTALCPGCTVDSVIGSASGYPAGDLEFLRAMRAYWFAGA